MPLDQLAARSTRLEEKAVQVLAGIERWISDIDKRLEGDGNDERR